MKLIGMYEQKIENLLKTTRCPLKYPKRHLQAFKRDVEDLLVV